jgi:predicted HTH transcriptional regulator
VEDGHRTGWRCRIIVPDIRQIIDEAHSIHDVPNSLKSSLKSSLKTDEKILELIRQNNQISYDALAAAVNITRRAIAKQIKKLQEEGKLRRVGPDKGGTWEVL